MPASCEGCSVMSYLLGFPTPVLEVLILLVVFVLGCALYFGYKFEPPLVGEESPSTTGSEDGETTSSEVSQ